MGPVAALTGWNSKRGILVVGSRLDPRGWVPVGIDAMAFERQAHRHARLAWGIAAIRPATGPTRWGQ